MNQPGYQALRDDIRALYDDLSALHPLPESARRRWPPDGRPELSGPCHVVVCGEFSRGKSSLLNALVERPGLFPTRSAVNTSVVTELRWGPAETAEVHLGDDRPLRIPIDQVAGYVTEQDNPENAKNVRLVRLTAPLALLRDGLVLIDTPGIGSLNIAHATATYAALGQADAVLFVAAADERMSTTELSYLAAAMDRCPVVITALTKIDNLIDPGPRIEVEVARERIADRTGRPVRTIDVVGVSARRKRSAIKDGSARRLRESGFPELEELLIRRLVATWGAGHLGGALDAFGDVVATMAAPISTELLALSGDNALDEVRAELDTTRARARELGSGSATWRRDLNELLRTEAAKIRARLDDDCASVRDAFLAGARSPKALDDPATLVRETAAALVDAAETAGRALRATAEQAATTAAEQTRLMLTVEVEDLRCDVDELDVPDALLDRGRRSGLESVFKSAATGAGVGAGLGAALGNLVLPGVGTLAGVVGGLVGNVVGLLSGLRDQVEQTRTERRERRTDLLNTLVLPRLERMITRLGSDVDSAVTTTTDRLLNEFDNRIRTTREAHEETIASLEQLRAATEQERVRRRADLTARLTRFEELADRRAALSARTAELAGSDG